MGIRFGIDLGGTKIEIVAIDEKGSELLRRRVPTPQNNYQRTLATMVELVDDAESQLGQRGTVGIGIPGAEARFTGLVKNANSTWLIGQPFRQDIQELMRRAVRIANDANCFTLSEAVDGAAAGVSVVFGVILGSGVGGGLSVNGNVLVGANRIAGEWGHNLQPWEDAVLPDCYCGRQGCVETFLSGPGLQRDHELVTGERLQPHEIAEMAAGGDDACEATLRRYEQRLARALAQVINIVDPDVIVLGGGLSKLTRLYDNVPKLWGDYVFTDRVVTRLIENRHGDSSGVRGAAWL